MHGPPVFPPARGHLLPALRRFLRRLMYGVGSGIEKANKVMMPIFFILFVILGIYVAFQPGAAAGYRYIFRVEPEVLAKPSTWIFALGQAFFSLSVAGNGTLIYGSYLPDSEDIPASAARVALFDTLAAMLAALVIIPAMATTGAKRSRTSVYLPAAPDQNHACRTDHCHHLFRSCVPCRHDLAYEPL